jgi:hypothetical protein
MPAPKPGTVNHWATSATGIANTTTPPSGTQDDGWTPNTAPPAQYFNWWMNLIGAWIAYLNDLAAQAWTWTGAHIFQGNVSVTSGHTVDVGTNRIQNVGAPSSGADAATKTYADGVGSTEASARAAADTTLQNNINALAAKAGGPVNWAGVTGLGPNTTNYLSVCGAKPPDNSDANAIPFIPPVNGVIKNLQVSAKGGGGSSGVDVTLHHQLGGAGGASDTSMTVHLAGGAHTGADNTNAITVSAGDWLNLKVVVDNTGAAVDPLTASFQFIPS